MKPFSPDLQVAFKILEFNCKKDPVWTGKLYDIFKDTMTKNQISNCLDTLTDWDIIHGKYGETEPGRSGYCYFINPDHIATLEKTRENGESK